MVGDRTVPSTAFDTFFACTLIVMAVLIATAFLGVTLQARIAGTDDINKDSYLKALADHIVTYPGSPINWGKENTVPSDFGLALSELTGAYQLDIDKISRLNSQNTNTFSYVELLYSAKLNNMSLGISATQVMDLHVEQLDSEILAGVTYSDLSLSTSINSKPISADLRYYVVSENFFYNDSSIIPSSGNGILTVHVPTHIADVAYVVLFARSTFEERITSYAVYSFADGVQESVPKSIGLSLSPQSYRLNFTQASLVSVQNVFALTYGYSSNITSFQGSSCAIPRMVDNSPIVLVACGQNSTQYLEEWTAYPQVPLTAGSTFANSERNIFGYLVTVEGVLYRVEISLGDIYR
jgi:hypothetical protein